jgi:hypothetical protein
MTRRTLYLVVSLVATMVVLSIPGQTQTGTPIKLGGIIDDYTPTLDANGPWQISGEWWLTLKGNSGRGDFSAALNMVRSDNPVRSPHTHHVTLTDGDVTLMENGFRISGNATIISNGSLAGFSGSPVNIQISGGSEIQTSNIALLFGGPATSHFGDQPFHGVVTQRQ